MLLMKTEKEAKKCDETEIENNNKLRTKTNWNVGQCPT